MESILDVKDLVKRYGQLVAVDHLNMSVKRGEIFGLLGPNGSGKTTVINCILSLLKYDQGEIRIFGEKMSPNNCNLTVRENIEFFAGLYIQDRQRKKKLVDEVIEFVRLEKHEKFRASKLSGGLKRRLHIACGIVHRPELVILDEPTVAVDAQSRDFILNGIRKLRDEGSTIIYTTHYLEEAETLCERFSILDNGKNIANGKLNELRELVSTSEIVHLCVEDENPELLSKLSTVPGLLQIENKDNGYQLKFGRKHNGLISLLELLEENHWSYKSLYSTQPSLTEVFLALTGKELRE
ncbi:MAG: ABC transporter ATP-binding protein [Eubacteriales bacterium]|nr:ABC transporter ATP-binding protein [Eubacteriales bacterium]